LVVICIIGSLILSFGENVDNNNIVYSSSNIDSHSSYTTISKRNLYSIPSYENFRYINGVRNNSNIISQAQDSSLKYDLNLSESKELNKIDYNNKYNNKYNNDRLNTKIAPLYKKYVPNIDTVDFNQEGIREFLR